MNRLVHLSVKAGYAEGSLMRVKTSRTKEKLCTFLPVIMPTRGLLVSTDLRLSWSLESSWAWKRCQR